LDGSRRVPPDPARGARRDGEGGRVRPLAQGGGLVPLRIYDLLFDVEPEGERLLQESAGFMLARSRRRSILDNAQDRQAGAVVLREDEGDVVDPPDAPQG